MQLCGCLTGRILPVFSHHISVLLHLRSCLHVVLYVHTAEKALKVCPVNLQSSIPTSQLVFFYIF